jgi:hypothetical protein
MEKLFYFDIGRLDADIEIAGVKITQPLVKIGATSCRKEAPYGFTFQFRIDIPAELTRIGSG